jgi:hypothetical protein
MKRIKKTICQMSLGPMLALTAPLCIASKTADQTRLSQIEFEKWQNFHSVPGRCKISFPEAPEHMHQTMSLDSDQSDLKYDVYVAAQEKEAVYMVLIAQYPDFVEDTYAELSLESFLNGILKQNPQNQLIFADLVDVQGYKGLDFFIRSNGVYFKGRTVMAKNNLYLLAMECEMNKYKEHHFDYFINSFEILK